MSHQVASYTGSLRFLRITWILWLTTFLPLYAYPVVCYAIFGPSQGLVDDHFSSRIVTDEDWCWCWFDWLPPLFAIILPMALHAHLARRIGRPFALTRDMATPPGDYRSARPLTVTLSPHIARRRIAIHAGRIVFAMACSVISYRSLSSTMFLYSRGHFSVGILRTVPEHLFFLTLLLAVTAFHVPTARSVFGEAPRISRGG